MWKLNFQGCLRKNREISLGLVVFFNLEFRKGVTQICRISMGESLFFLEFLTKVKVTSLKIPGFFFRKVSLNLPSVWFLV